MGRPKLYFSDAERREARNIAQRKLRAKAERKKLEKRYSRERYLRHIAVVNSYKEAAGCTHCGETDPIVLQFHHLDPTEKDFSIGAKIRMSLDTIVKEMQKCIVLCANCHLKEHARLRDSKEG